MTRLVFAALAVLASNVVAGSELSAQTPFTPLSARTPFPPVPGRPTTILGTTPLSPPPASNECLNGFAPLREEAEKKADLVKTASRRHALPAETCKLIADYHAAEAKMIEYVESNAARCGIAAQITIQLRATQKNTEDARIKVCTIAGQGKKPAGPIGDFYPRGAIDSPI
jgi:hypothetical protein